MEKEELIKFCRYYKGEEENPFDGKEQNKAMLWFYESVWINEQLSDKDSSILTEYINDYALVGLSDFEIHDSIPFSLKALLFNRYAKGSYSMFDAAKPFKEFYRKYYKRSA